MKSKTLMSWSSRKKKEDIFCTIYFIRMEDFYDLCFISMYSALNALLEYTYFYLSKNITSCTFVHALLVFKIVESLQCILKKQRLNPIKSLSKTY